MTDRNQESAIAATAHILKNYGFESPAYSYDRKIDEWLKSYPFSWIRLALTESLYQGRYKIVSLERILLMWKRKGEPSFHFNREFERLVLNKIPHNLNAPKAKSAPDYTSFPHREFSSHRQYSRSFQPLRIEEPLTPKGSSEQHLKSSQIKSSQIESSPSQLSQTRLPAIDDEGEDFFEQFNEGSSFSDAESSVVEHSQFDNQIEEWLDETQSLAFDPVFPLRRKLPLTVEELSGLDVTDLDETDLDETDLDETDLDETAFEDAQEDISLIEEGYDVHDGSSPLVQSHPAQSAIGFHQPIVQFSPKPKSSGFYFKLAAIAHPNL